MKIRTIVVSAALACALGAVPAFAQTADQDMQQYMSTHPALQANPSLINDPAYLARHPDLAHFLEMHPQVDRARYGGAYDTHHHWRDADWWHRHDPGWVTANHPEWNNYHPSWGAAHAEPHPGVYAEPHPGVYAEQHGEVHEGEHGNVYKAANGQVYAHPKNEHHNN